MKRLLLTTVSLLALASVNAQNVGVGTNAPHPSAKLDISANADPNARGLLIPQMNLATAGFPAPGPATSLLVYNTNAGFGGGVGYFYNEGTPASPVWRRITNGSNSVNSLSVNAPLNTSGGVNPTISIPQGNAGADGFIDNADWITFNNKVTAVAGSAPITIGGTVQNPTVNIPQATGSSDGYLDSGDWNTFNNKISTVTALAPVVVAGTLPNRQISMPQANGGTDGFLDATDWTTFNNKVTSVAVNAPLTTTGGPLTPTLGLGTVGTPGTYTKVTTDAWGRVISAGTLVAADLPPSSGNYIQNQYAGAQSANMWISGETRTGSWFRNNAAGTGLYNETTGAGVYSPSAGLMSTYNASNFRIEGQRLIGNQGSASAYGALTVQGEKNGWGGLAFSNSAGTHLGTIMVGNNTEGFYNNANSAWNYYWAGGTLASVNNYFPANGVIRMTPNLHFNAMQNQTVWINYDNGVPSSNIWQFAVGNGGAGTTFYVRNDGWVSAEGGYNIAYCISCKNRSSSAGVGSNARCAGFGSWTAWSQQPNGNNYEDWCAIQLYKWY